MTVFFRNDIIKIGSGSIRECEYMELTSNMRNIMSQPGRKADYDKACKKLLSEKVILAWIMKSCLKEYQDCSISEIAENYIEEGTMQTGTAAVHRDEADAVSPGRISGSNTEDFTEQEGTVYFDVKFKAKLPGKEESIGLIVNIEAQKDFYPGYSLVRRALYYCSRMMSAQYETEFSGSEYQKLKKVCSIWVCTNPSKEKQNSITKYSVQEEIVVGNAKEDLQNYDLLTVMMLYLGDNSNEKILKLLHLLLVSDLKSDEKLSILEKEFEIAKTQVGQEVERMCNISEQIEERGIQKGIEESTISSIDNIMKNLNLSFEEAAKVLAIPASEWTKYKNLLNNK